MGAYYNPIINSNTNTNSNISHSTRTHNTPLKFLQINLQHSRAATNNLMKTIEEEEEEEGIDIICIQEPFVIKNKVIGILRKYKTLVQGEGRIRAAIVITNKIIDSILIRQLSDEDAVVVEVVYHKLKIIIGSMYLQIEYDLNKIEAIMQQATGTGTILAIDSNARSTTWHGHITNRRGRILEEFRVSLQLHILNEDSNLTTYLSSHGSSNIDLMVTSNLILRAVEEWEVSDQESCSDHSYMKFAIRQDSHRSSMHDSHEVRYIIRREDIVKFQGNLITLLDEKYSTPNAEGGTEDLDFRMSNRVRECQDIEQAIDKFHETIKIACDETFRRSQATGKTTNIRSIPGGQAN
jgi:hypothetical protein